MKGQGETGKKVTVGQKDKSNNNSVHAEEKFEVHKDDDKDLSEEEDEEDVESQEDGEEEDDLVQDEEKENEEIVNASLVVNLSENQSHLNSLNSFSFHNSSKDLNQNQSSSTLSNSDDSSVSMDSPLASSRSAPPDLGDYSSSTTTKTSARETDRVEGEQEGSSTPKVPVSILVNQPTFTSTPKQQQQQNPVEAVNGGGTPLSSVLDANDPQAAMKKKLSVTFADIVKQNAEDKNLPPYILSEEEEDGGDTEEEEVAESVYFSLGQTPPGSLSQENPKLLAGSESNPRLEDSLANASTHSVNNDSSLNGSMANDRSELDIASVSQAQVNGSEESSDTLINVSNWNATLNESSVSPPPAKVPKTNNDNSSNSLLSRRDELGSGDHLGLDRVTANVDDEAADEEVHKINANLLLPNTVTELVASNGVKVYVIGTAHFSEQSQHDVVEAIQKLHPTLVVLELCHSRRNILTLDEETILRESADMSLGKVKEAINQSGAVQGTLHLLLLSMSAQLTKKLGMAPGGEFRAAVREARNVPGCLLLLGDRPFKVTLSRALAALSFGQKLKLAWQFLTSNDDITKDEIERCKEKDLLERMMMEMTGEFPAISRVFVSERDIYLAHSLWLAATSTSHKNQGGPIVGVVGMGHVAGISQNWGKTTEEQIANLMIIPEPSVTSIIVRSTLKYSFYALLGYGVYRLSRRAFDFPSSGLVQSTWERIPPITTKSLGISR